jgi:uncharacterized membrane protein YraQ (UPF0718 family)
VHVDQNLKVFCSTIIAIFLEASPFLFLGSLLSALVDLYVPEDKLERLLPKGKLLGLGCGLVAGMLIPTCECGVVSLVRRFLKKGVAPHVAITYMLSAPVVNPLVLAATYIAFQGNIWMVVGRVSLVAACAICFGWATSSIDPALLLRQKERDSLVLQTRSACDDPIEPGTPSSSLGLRSESGCHSEGRQDRALTQVFVRTASEFLDMGRYLILGSIVVASLKISLSQDVVLLFQENLFLSVGALMLLAVLVSVCSEADAFVAAGFSTFPAVARLSFVAIGPIVDLKLVLMYASVFRKRIILALVLVPSIVIYLLSIILGMIIR